MLSRLSFDSTFNIDSRLSFESFNTVFARSVGGYSVKGISLICAKVAFDNNEERYMVKSIDGSANVGGV